MTRLVVMSNPDPRFREFASLENQRTNFFSKDRNVKHNINILNFEGDKNLFQFILLKISI